MPIAKEGVMKYRGVYKTQYIYSYTQYSYISSKIVSMAVNKFIIFKYF